MPSSATTCSRRLSSSGEAGLWPTCLRWFSLALAETLLRRWAYGLPYRSAAMRAADLPRCLRHANLERPLLVSLVSHQSLGSRLAPQQPPQNPQLGVLGDLLVQRLRFARRAASTAEVDDAHDTDDRALGEGQHVARPHPVMRLGDDRLVDAQTALTDQLRRERPRLEETGLPQPFVEPEALGRRVRRVIG